MCCLNLFFSLFCIDAQPQSTGPRTSQPERITRPTHSRFWPGPRLNSAANSRVPPCSVSTILTIRLLSQVRGHLVDVCWYWNWPNIDGLQIFLKTAYITWVQKTLELSSHYVILFIIYVPFFDKLLFELLFNASILENNMSKMQSICFITILMKHWKKKSLKMFRFVRWFNLFSVQFSKFQEFSIWHFEFWPICIWNNWNYTIQLDNRRGL